MTLFFALPDYLTGFNFLMGLFTFLILVAAAIIVLLVRGKGEVATLQVDRAVAAEALVKTRDAEKLGLEARNKTLEEELEEVTAEHRTLAAIDVAKLFEFWAQKEQIEAEMLDLKRQIRILEKRKDGDL